jgi:ribonucleoside-diphosphate reductase alpha chain
MSYGIEPSFGKYYWKRTRISGQYKYYFNVPRVVRDAYSKAGYEIPMKSDTIEDTWDGSKGKSIIEFMENHMDKVGGDFINATEVDPLKKMDLMSKVMKWVDSSISVTYLLPENTDIETVENFILRGWEAGVKSIAAFPDSKIYGIISFTPFKDLALNLIKEGKQIHAQNFSDEERNELNIHEAHISYSSAPKRPKTLEADIYTVSVKGDKFVVAVGLLNGAPYEIFAGSMNGLNFKFREKRGKITKVRRGVYRLAIGDELEIDDFSGHFKPVEKSLFRLASTNLRHGVPIKFIVEQLGKSTEALNSLTAAASRVLKKYIHDGEVATGMSCPNGHTTLIYEEGCVKCVTCDWSKCE